MKGWVYVLSMENTVEGIVKIGSSSKDVMKRACDLGSRTAAVGNCKVEYSAYCQDYKTVEKEVHKLLSNYRIDNREWFTCGRAEAISVIKQSAIIEHEDPPAPIEEGPPYQVTVSIWKHPITRVRYFRLQEPEDSSKTGVIVRTMAAMEKLLVECKRKHGRNLRTKVWFLEETDFSSTTRLRWLQRINNIVSLTD